ncbi:toxin-antitoxin system YwqK family antitoxin [uncultured Lutibacter sp.]|uniref:toxin-antitoxin system YwqK family antitoxin n=1 Tax=uncultured Lutibacter sp. TaxID=437739 RepID=UPI002638D242|nr:toxin-antitoxin system YwqK family antitoxin [uncultured Lutibacter sp.]
MKKKIVYILGFIFLLVNQLNAQEKINQFDLNGKRDGVWKKYYSNKNIRYQGTFKSGKEVGVFKYYSIISSKHPTIIKTFSEKSDLAKVNFYTFEGVLESFGEMKGKNRIGTWLYYYPDKTLMIEENYKNGLLDGTYKSFYKTGKPNEIFNYTAGKLNGNAKRYADNGSILEDLYYKNGKLEGEAKYYNINGELIYYGNYENDEKVGKWKYVIKEENETNNKLKQ